MSITDKALERLGLKYEDLTQIERDTLLQWEESLKKNEVTVLKVKEYISLMRDAVEKELEKTLTGTKQDIFLKARLRNYRLLDGYLSTPEKAKQVIDQALAGIVSSKGAK